MYNFLSLHPPQVHLSSRAGTYGGIRDLYRLAAIRVGAGNEWMIQQSGRTIKSTITSQNIVSRHTEVLASPTQFQIQYKRTLSKQRTCCRFLHVQNSPTECSYTHSRTKYELCFVLVVAPSGSPDNTTRGLHLACPPRNRPKSQLKVPGSSYNSALHHVLSKLLMTTPAVSCHYIILHITSGIAHLPHLARRLKTE